MSRDRRGAVVLGAFVVLAVAAATCARAADAPGVEAKAALARLKSLAGDWDSRASAGGHAPSQGKVSYRVTAGGTAVMETLFAGTDHEMVTVYHLDGPDLRLTHYCASGNQPRMKLDRAASTATTLVFAFDGGTNLDAAKDYHMHSGKITFQDPRHVRADWDGYGGGKKVATHAFELSRP